MTSEPQLDTYDMMLLCALRLWPEQRVVHQHAGYYDKTGHCCAPESVFMRRMGSGLLSVRKPAFRRLVKGAWLTRTLAGDGEGPQDEYQISERAEERFATDHEWQQTLFFVKSRLPPPRMAA